MVTNIYIYSEVRMRNLSVLSLAFLVVACNGAGGGSTSPDVAGGSVLSASQALSNFESNHKAQAEALEDNAVLRFNPCRDDLNWQSTGATTGTVEFSGVTFNAANVSSIIKNGDCDYTVNTGDTNGLTNYTFTPTTQVDMTGDYTTIQIVNGGSITMESDSASYASPSLSISETGAHASFLVGDSSGNNLFKILYRRLMQASIQNSTSYALFEVDSSNATVDIEHYNSETGSLLPLTENKSVNFDQDANPSIVSNTLSIIRMSHYQDNSVNFFYNTKGGVAFIMFDRHLTSQEKTLMGCYALYLSTKTGSNDLWNANYQAVCDL
jgi:hypothetical protein